MAIVGANDPPILGALQALVAAGRDDVALVGFDAIPDVVQAIIDGSVDGTVAQFPKVMGTVGVDLMIRHLNGEEVPAQGRLRRAAGDRRQRGPVPGRQRLIALAGSGMPLPSVSFGTK